MSITEIAGKVGVSASTVSRVINNRPGIAEETRALVFKAMSNMGYEPKPIRSRPGPKAHVSAKSGVSNVALISFVRYRSQINSPVYAEIVHGVESELAKKGANMLFKSFREETDILSWIDSVGVDGLVLFGVSEKLPEEIYRRLSTIPLVGVLGDRDSYDFDHVFYDIDRVAHLAIEFFLEENIKEVLLLCQTKQRQRFEYLSSLNGIHTENTGHGDKVFVTNESVNGPDHKLLDAVLSEYLKSHKLPKGIFIPCDSYAVPLYSILMHKGYVPGDDFKVVSVNNEASLLSGLMPRPATVDIRSFELGRAAVQRLIWRREHFNEPTSVLTLAPLLVRP